jgi:hypothetical protein
MNNTIIGWVCNTELDSHPLRQITHPTYGSPLSRELASFRIIIPNF